MTRSTKKSGPIAGSVRNAKRATLSLRGLVGLAETQKWLAVPDVVVLVRAVSSSHPDSPNKSFVQAAAGALFTCVISQDLRDEVTAVLARPKFGSMSRAAVDDALGPFWDACRIIEMAPDDPRYQRFVKDPGDVPVLRIAAGVFFLPDLAEQKTRFIVSADGKAFRPGLNWNGFACTSAHDFWKMLKDTLPS